MPWQLRPQENRVPASPTYTGSSTPSNEVERARLPALPPPVNSQATQPQYGSSQQAPRQITPSYGGTSEPQYGTQAYQQPAQPQYGTQAYQQPAEPAQPQYATRGYQQPAQQTQPQYGSQPYQQPAQQQYGTQAYQQPQSPSRGYATTPQRVETRRAPRFGGLFSWFGGGWSDDSREAAPAPGVQQASLQPAANEEYLHRKFVASPFNQEPGTIIIDTEERFLYLQQEGGQALRYGVGVGRQGFEWSGSATIGRKAEWPDWIPPDEMREREPWLPERMPGGLENPLGARALYLYEGSKDTLYRIHGTNQPETIGLALSSGCIRMLNDDVMDLYQRVPEGTKVVVL